MCDGGRYALHFQDHCVCRQQAPPGFRIARSTGRDRHPSSNAACRLFRLPWQPGSVLHRKHPCRARDDRGRISGTKCALGSPFRRQSLRPQPRCLRETASAEMDRPRVRSGCGILIAAVPLLRPPLKEAPVSSSCHPAGGTDRAIPKSDFFAAYSQAGGAVPHVQLSKISQP